VQQAALKRAEKAFRELVKQRKKELRDRVQELFKTHLNEAVHPMQFAGGPLVQKVLAPQVKYLEPYVTSQEDLERWRSVLVDWRRRCEDASMEQAEMLQIVSSQPAEGAAHHESFEDALAFLVRSLEQAAEARVLRSGH